MPPFDMDFYFLAGLVHCPLSQEDGGRGLHIGPHHHGIPIADASPDASRMIVKLNVNLVIRNSTVRGAESTWDLENW